MLSRGRRGGCGPKGEGAGVVQRGRGQVLSRGGNGCCPEGAGVVQSGGAGVLFMIKQSLEHFDYKSHLWYLIIKATWLGMVVCEGS